MVIFNYSVHSASAQVVREITQQTRHCFTKGSTLTHPQAFQAKAAANGYLYIETVYSIVNSARTHTSVNARDNK